MKRYSIVLALLTFSLLALAIYQLVLYRDNKVHVIFCNVGQGDGIMIRTPSGKVILIDGGPDDSMLACLSSHLPFWQKKIDLVMLTDSRMEHINGLLFVAQRYKILHFVTEREVFSKSGFFSLQKILSEKKVPVSFLLTGDAFHLSDGVFLRIVGPATEFSDNVGINSKTFASQEIRPFETLLSYGTFSAFFTGDSQADELIDAIDQGWVSPVTVLQIPYHGSGAGSNDFVLRQLRSQLGVISVGKKNKYGYPSVEVLSLLENNRIPFLRTDTKGTIEVISDGKNWQVVR